MVLPTEEDRALWRKAIQTPGAIADEERRTILGLVDSSTQLSNCLEITSMSPEELEKKALKNPASLTKEECRLIRHGYHIWNQSEGMVVNKMNWPFEDQMASIDAVVAVLTPNEDTIRRVSSIQGNSIAKQESDTLRVALQKAADNIGKPCAWVERLIDRSVPLNAIDMQPSWGFVLLRDAKTECSNEDWEVFLQKLETTFFEGVSWLVGGEQINQTRKLVWQDQFVDEYEHNGLHRAFKDVVRLSSGPQQHILQNTFLLITPQVVASFESSSTTPWIWAFDGRLKVASTSVFTWCYAARKEEIYGMNRF